MKAKQLLNVVVVGTMLLMPTVGQAEVNNDTFEAYNNEQIKLEKEIKVNFMKEQAKPKVVEEELVIEEEVVEEKVVEEKVVEKEIIIVEKEPYQQCPECGGNFYNCGCDGWCGGCGEPLMEYGNHECNGWEVEEEVVVEEETEWMENEDGTYGDGYTEEEWYECPVCYGDERTCGHFEY